MSAEAIIERRHKVLAQYLSPGGLGRHNVEAVAKRLGVSKSTAWDDLKVVREKWSKKGNPIIPDASTVQARIEAALSVAWSMVTEEDEDGERAYDAETILKALDRVYKGIDLQAKVAGSYAAEKVEVNHSADARGGVAQEDLDYWMAIGERLAVYAERLELGTLSPAEEAVYRHIVGEEG